MTRTEDVPKTLDLEQTDLYRTLEMLGRNMIFKHGLLIQTILT